MDIKEVTKSLLSAANVKSIAGKAGATQTQVKSVLSSALPSLLGGKETSAEEISKETGVSKAKTNGILSAAGPLLSGLLGGGSSQNESSSSQASGTAALLGSLLGSVNIGSLASGLMNLVSADDDDEKEEEKPKKPKSGKKKKTESAASGKKPASGKKTDSKKKTESKKTDKKETKKSSPLDSVTDLLGGLFK